MQGSERIDYSETPDVTEIHAAIQREHRDPVTQVTPVPLWVTLLCGLAVCWAGAYIGMFHGGFNGNVYNEYESSPAVLFPLPPRTGGKAGPAAPENLVAVGKGVYQANCQSCHQPTGQGVPGTYPPLAGSEWVTGSEKRLAMILLKGISGPMKVGSASFNNVMPPWEAALSDKKIAAVLSYIRQEWGNKAGEIQPAQIAAARKEFAGWKNPWSEAELLQIPADATLEGGAPASGAAPAAAISAAPGAAATSAAGPTTALASTSPGVSAEAGKAVYMMTCVACHQPNGQGLPNIFPSLVKSEYVSGSSERLIAMILKGIMPPFNYQGFNYTQLMTPQEGIITDDAKLASVATYVRSNFGNSAPPVTVEEAAAARKKFADRKTPWTEAELNNWPAK